MPNHQLLRVTILVSLLALPSVSHGQEATRDTVVARGVSVMARKPSETALAITRLDSLELKNSRTASLDELIAKHTPIFVKSYGLGSLATVSFRGTAPSHTTVLWNDLTINTPNLGQVDFSALPVRMTDRVELLSGASSLSQSSGALGGTVVLKSIPDRGEKIFAEVQETYGSYGLWNSYATLGGGDDKWRARVRYIYEQARNDFEFTNTAVPPFDKQKQAQADYRKHTATADLNGTLGDGHFLDVNMWYSSASRSLPPIMSYQGKGRDEWQGDHEVRGAVAWRFYTNKVTSSLTAGVTYTSLGYLMASNTDLGQVVNNDSYSQTATGQLKYSIDWAVTPRTTLRGMMNAMVSSVETRDRVSTSGYSAGRFDGALSISVHHRFANAFAGYLLVRAENNGAIIPSIGMEITPVRDFTIKINGARNYHRPTLNDLYWIPGGNPELQPEKGWQGDIALAYRKVLADRVTLEAGVTGYMAWVDDWIQWRPSEYRYWVADNVKSVFSRGIESALTVAYKAPSTFGIALRASYSYTPTTSESEVAPIDASRGKQLIYIPLHKASALLSVEYRGYYAHINWNYTSERFTTTSNEPTMFPLEGYDLCDLAVGKDFRMGLYLNFKIQNLFDTSYQAILFRPMPGRSFIGSVGYRFGLKTKKR